MLPVLPTERAYSKAGSIPVSPVPDGLLTVSANSTAARGREAIGFLFHKRKRCDMLVLKRNNGEGISITGPDGQAVCVFVTVQRGNTTSIGIEAPQEYRIARITDRKVKTGQKQRRKNDAARRARRKGVTQKQEATNAQEQGGDERVSPPAGKIGRGVLASVVCAVCEDGRVTGDTGENCDPA